MLKDEIFFKIHNFFKGTNDHNEINQWLGFVVGVTWP